MNLSEHKLQKQVMPFALHKTKPIQQPTGTKKDLSITMTSRSPKTSHASILFSLLLWAGFRQLLQVHNTAGATRQPTNQPTPFTNAWSDNLGGRPSAPCARGLRVPPPCPWPWEQQAHCHQSSLWLWGDKSGASDLPSYNINVSIQKASKNGEVEMQILKRRFKCNYKHQLFAIKLIRLWPFHSDYIIFVLSKIKVVRPKKIPKMLTHKPQLLSIFHYHTDFKNTEQFKPASHLALARDKCLR